MAWEFYLDHDVSQLLALELRRTGFVALTARQLGRQRGRDHEHLAYAAQRGYVLLTCNSHDYELLHFAWLDWPLIWQMTPPVEHAGVLILPHRPPQQNVSAIVALVSSLRDANALRNKLFVWSLSRHAWLP